MEDPRSLATGLARIAARLGTRLSRDTLRRRLKEAGYRWKRMRRSLRARRDEADFRAAKAQLDELRRDALAPAAAFDLVYCDAAGFTTQPCIPYAWQPTGETHALPSAHSPRLNVLGFLHLTGDFHSAVFDTPLDSATLAASCDDFARRLARPAILVLDNAPVHKSAAFLAHRSDWEELGLFLFFLPPYSPELNLIELLWRKIKYEWLPLSAYESFNELRAALLTVLKGVGSKYRLTFA